MRLRPALRQAPQRCDRRCRPARCRRSRCMACGRRLRASLRVAGAAGIQTNSSMLTASSAPTDHRPDRVAAPRRVTRTSSSVGPLCRWRSASDFFSASRMRDISCLASMPAVRMRLQQRRIRRRQRGVQRHLRFDAGDAVDRQAIGALELFDQLHQARIVFIAGRGDAAGRRSSDSSCSRSCRTGAPRMPALRSRTSLRRRDATAARSRRTSSASARRY